MLAIDQAALVTGASGGIGQAIAAALAARGLRVIMTGRNMKKLRKASRTAGANTSSFVADLTTEAGRAAAASQTHPKLHVLIHCAGVYGRSEVTALSADQWRALDAINLYAPILLTAACMPQLRAACGQVVFINSSAALTASAGLSAYGAGKRGLQAAAQALRDEVNAEGIRVVSIFPGRTDTPMQRALLEAEQRAAPPGTLMQPEDVASMVMAALDLPRTSEVTDIVMRPMRKL
jgi:NADP-dependent 3-hydroxy acid dehydrogenase YdfG